MKSIHIESISAENLGPITKRVDFQFGLINLIYGKNEKGKTYLVELILRSLFRNSPKFNREMNGQGKVVVTGLPKDPFEFSLNKKEKLDDFLNDANDSFSASIHKLFVIHGGELDFVDDDPSGINKQTLKDFLSNQKLLDSIEKPIHDSVKEATFENGIFIRKKNQGEIKNLNKLEDNYKNICELQERVDKEYSEGNPKKLLEKSIFLESEKQKIIDAKCHKAYLLSKEIENKKLELLKIPKNKRDEIRDNIRDLKQLNRNLKEVSKQKDDTKIPFEQYLWLENAVSNYTKLTSLIPQRKSSIFLILGIVSLAIGIIPAALKIPFPVIGCILLGIFFFIMHIAKSNQLLIHQTESTELKKLHDEFVAKFPNSSFNLNSLQSNMKIFEADYYDHPKEIDLEKSERNKIKILENKVSKEYSDLGLLNLSEAEFDESYKVLEQKVELIESELKDLQRDHDTLNIPKDEYVEESNSIEYQSILERKNQNEISKVENDIKEEENLLQDLRISLSRELNFNSASITELLERLSFEKQAKLEELLELKSRIFAQNLVSKAISEIRQKEDTNIRANLKSEIVKKPLYQITHRYNDISLNAEGHILVSDGVSDYALSALSTGAKEQVLLALRIGILSNIFGKESAFLILDDAFQHSDWERRVYLINTICELAKNGWQIIYFSMDDHIKKLFEIIVKKTFGAQYHYFEI